MEVSSKSNLVSIPESWKHFFTEKPGREYNDVLEKDLRFWKSNNPLHRGYLMVKAERKRFMQKDWMPLYIIILSDLVLLLKDCKEPNNKPYDYITLSPLDTITAQERVSGKHKFCFAIKTAHKDDRDWVFCAPNLNEMQMWVAAFEASIDFIRHKKIQKWCLEILEKEKSLVTMPHTEDVTTTLRHVYTYVAPDEDNVYEHDSDDVDLYEPIQGVDKCGNLPSRALTKDSERNTCRSNVLPRKELLYAQKEIDYIEDKNRNNIQEFGEIQNYISSQLRKMHVEKLAVSYNFTTAEKDRIHNSSEPSVIFVELLTDKGLISESYQKLKGFMERLRSNDLGGIADNIEKKILLLLCPVSGDGETKGYVTLTKRNTDKSTSDIYYNMVSTEPTMRSSYYSRSIYDTSSPIQGADRTGSCSSSSKPTPPPKPKPSQYRRKGPNNAQADQYLIRRHDQGNDGAHMADLKQALQKRTSRLTNF